MPVGSGSHPLLVSPFPRASSAVQNGLLVLNMLINHHKGLAEQLGNSDLHAILQSCCRAGQSSNEILARIVLKSLAEHKLPLSQENAGTHGTRPAVSDP